MKDPTVEILFGEKIRKTQRDLAKAVGVAPKTITNWRRKPSSIPKGKLDILIRCNNLTNEEILAMHGRKAK